jgi:hypothetical protein
VKENHGALTQNDVVLGSRRRHIEERRHRAVCAPQLRVPTQHRRQSDRRRAALRALHKVQWEEALARKQAPHPEPVLTPEFM